MTASDKEQPSDKRQASVLNDSDQCNKTNEGSDQCYLCHCQTSDKCPQCGLPSCSTHLKTHLTADNVCLPFVIQYKEGVGNFVVASRDIEPNEVKRKCILNCKFLTVL